MEKTKQEWSRLKFVRRMTGTGVLMLLNPAWSWTVDDIDPRVTAIVNKTIGVDSHNHIDVPISSAELPGRVVDLAGQMKQSGLSVICMTFAIDYLKLNSPGEA